MYVIFDISKGQGHEGKMHFLAFGVTKVAIMCISNCLHWKRMHKWNMQNVSKVEKCGSKVKVKFFVSILENFMMWPYFIQIMPIRLGNRYKVSPMHIMSF